MSPANIIAGFRTCGVYPFNPSAISATPHTEHEDDTGTSVATSTSSSCDDKVREESSRNKPKQQCDRTESDVVPPTSTALFTEEQERRFRIRFEEGFNVFMDDDYVRWLEIHHLESLPHSTTEDFTLAAHFSSVSPAAQVASVVTENILPVSPRIIKLQPWCNELSDLNDQDNSPSTSRQTPAEVSPSTSRQTPVEVSPSTSCQTPAEVSPSTSRQTPAEVSPSTSRQAPAEVSPSTSCQAPAEVSPSLSGAKKSQTSLIKIREEPSRMSKYITLPQVTPVSKTILRARLLTSADAMAQAEEKERKKKLALEEKERRKVEREEKKRQKNFKDRQKAEEKLKKTEIKAKKVSDKQKVTKKTALRDSTRRGSCSEPPRKKCHQEKQGAGCVTEINTNEC